MDFFKKVQRLIWRAYFLNTTVSSCRTETVLRPPMRVRSELQQEYTPECGAATPPHHHVYHVPNPPRVRAEYTAEYDAEYSWSAVLQARPSSTSEYMRSTCGVRKEYAKSTSTRIVLSYYALASCSPAPPAPPSAPSWMDPRLLLRRCLRCTLPLQLLCSRRSGYDARPEYTRRDAYSMYSVCILSSPYSCQSTTGVDWSKLGVRVEYTYILVVDIARAVCVDPVNHCWIPAKEIRTEKR